MNRRIVFPGRSGDGKSPLIVALLESRPAKGYGVAIMPQGAVTARVAWIRARLDRGE